MDTAFDEGRYTREVLEPAQRADSTPPADLRVRYQLHELMSPAEVTETVRRVRQCWRRKRGMLRFKRLADRLEADHARLGPIFSAAAEGDLEPLREALRESTLRAGQRVADARRRLDDAAGRLRMLPPDVLASIAASSGIDLRDAARLAAGLSIEVREPDLLPSVPPYTGYGRVREALETLADRHLAEFLYGERSGLRVLDGFALPDAEPLPQALDRVGWEWARRARGPRTTGADTVLAALRSVPDPAALVRYDLVARLRERVREHPYDDTLLRHAIADLGLADDEARRLIFAVRLERGVSGGATGRLRELVDAGEIQAAVEFADALEEGALTGEAADLAAEIRARLAAAVRLRDEARRADDPDEAWLALEDALRRVPDLPGTRDLLVRLAPRPVRELQAEIAGDGVLVSWRPASRAGEIVYDVTRNGVPFATTSVTEVRDDAPPVNEPVTYRVTARRGDASAMAVAAGPVMLRPEPRDVRVSAGDGLVTGAWSAPEGASRVVVTRDGLPVSCGDGGFRDRGVRNGTPYAYVVAAAYPAPGGEVITPGVRRVVTPRARPDPVLDFVLEPDPAEDGQFLVRCVEPANGLLEIVAVDAPPPWPVGATISIGELRRATRAVPTTPTREGPSVRPGAGDLLLLAVTVTGDLATVGAHREHVNLAAPGGLTAVRRGPSVLVGFDWPPDVPETEVRWNDTLMTVGRAAYQARGGVRLDVPEGEEVVIEVASTALIRGRRMRGAASAVRLAGRVAIGYDLIRAGGPWRRSLVVELTCDGPLRLARLRLVLKPGSIQPRSADDGRVLAEWTGVNAPARLTVPAPRQARPYWLRCFAEGDVELVDPPVRRLKAE